MSFYTYPIIRKKTDKESINIFKQRMPLSLNDKGEVKTTLSNVVMLIENFIEFGPVDTYGTTGFKVDHFSPLFPLDDVGYIRLRMMLSNIFSLDEISRDMMEDAVKFVLALNDIGDYQPLADVFNSACLSEHRFLLTPEDVFERANLSKDQNIELDALEEIAAGYRAIWLSDELPKEAGRAQTLKVVELASFIQGGAYEEPNDYEMFDYNNSFYGMPVDEGLAAYRKMLELYGTLTSYKDCYKLRRALRA